MTLWIQHLANEWRLAHAVSAAESDATVTVQIPSAEADLFAHSTLARFALSDSSAAIRLRPALADRPVVSYPERPLYIQEGEEVTVYVGSPLWISLESGSWNKKLLEIPIYRPSDTWFGPSPRVGELCYASRSFCRLRLDELPSRPHRARTAVLIENHAATPLFLERMKLPVLHLSMYEDAHGALWTQDVTLERLQDEELGSVRLRQGPPQAAVGAALLASPRRTISESFMFRAFSSLLQGD